MVVFYQKWLISEETKEHDLFKLQNCKVVIWYHDDKPDGDFDNLHQPDISTNRYFLIFLPTRYFHQSNPPQLLSTVLISTECLEAASCEVNLSFPFLKNRISPKHPWKNISKINHWKIIPQKQTLKNIPLKHPAKKSLKNLLQENIPQKTLHPSKTFIKNTPRR